MDCKHAFVEGNTTKYYVCSVYRKAVDRINCKDCPLRLPIDFVEYFNKQMRWK